MLYIFIYTQLCVFTNSTNSILQLGAKHSQCCAKECKSLLLPVKFYIKTWLITEAKLYIQTQDKLQPGLNQCSKVSESQRKWIENCWGVGRSFILVSHIKPKAANEKSIWSKKIDQQVVKVSPAPGSWHINRFIRTHLLQWGWFFRRIFFYWIQHKLSSTGFS